MSNKNLFILFDEQFPLIIELNNKYNSSLNFSNLTL